MSHDFAEILSELSDANAEYLIVGAHALGAHSRPRATGDLDIWVRPSPENARRVWDALARFGAPVGDITIDDLSRPDTIVQIGVVPQRVDILTSIDGVEFDDAWNSRITLTVFGQEVGVIGRDDLIRNKRAVGRLQDLADVEALEKGGPRPSN